MEAIERFLSVGYGSGYGYGYGSGSGDGSGDGYGSGYGYGYGYGSGSGSGDGSGDGYGSGYGYGYGYGSGDGYGYGDGSGSGDGYGSGITSFNGHNVYMIDDTPTLIYHVRGQIAVGAILRDDLTLEDCYIAKMGNFFAHGETARQAIADAQTKYEENRPLNERIASFVAAFPAGVKKPASDYFNWHHLLTGSCEMGRKRFCEQHGIDLEASYTPEFFIELTQDAYGGDVVKQLKDYYR